MLFQALAAALLSRVRLLAGVLVFAAACSPQTEPAKSGAVADGGAKIVNVYTARHYDADDRLFKAFEAETGIKPRLLKADGPQLLQRLKQEGDQTSADVILAVDAGNLSRLAQEGLVQPIADARITARVPAALRDPDGRWFGLTKRYRVIAYAKDRVKPVDVDSMDDLAAPPMRGRVCVRSSTNIYNLSLMASRIHRDGPDQALAWARGVVANFARQPQGSDTEQLRAIAGGDCDAAIVNHYYLVRMQASNDPKEREAGAKLAISVPDQTGFGAHLNVSGAAVGRYAKNKEAAIALIAFLAGPQAQSEVAALNDEFPVDAAIALPDSLKALGPIKDDVTPLSVYGALQSQAQSLFEQAGWR